MIRYAICLLALPLLAACGDDPAPVAASKDSRDATGDVLPGSISDEMLPLDSLTSTSPAARVTPSAGASGDKARSGAEAATGSQAAAETTASNTAEAAAPADAAEAESAAAVDGTAAQ